MEAMTRRYLRLAGGGGGAGGAGVADDDHAAAAPSSSTTTIDLNEEALVRCGTSKGPIVLKLTRRWSPHGYDRAVYLLEQGFFDHSHFFRVVPNYLVQFGISYTENAALKRLSHQTIPDDPQLDPPISFEPGIISYAGNGDNSRTSQLFIAYSSHSDSLGTQTWETPIGKVIEGMDHVNKFYSYGDMPPWGNGPTQGKIHSGRHYIDENFPFTDSFTTCHVERIHPPKEVTTVRPTSSSLAYHHHHHLEEPSSSSSSIAAKAARTLRHHGEKAHHRVMAMKNHMQDYYYKNNESAAAMLLSVALVVVLLIFVCVVVRFPKNNKAARGKTS